MNNVLPFQHPGVLEPSLSTLLVASCVEIERKECALVVGGGAGAIPIILAAKGADVVSIDIDPLATQLTLDNAAAFGISLAGVTADVRTWQPPHSYDRIVANPPQQPCPAHGSAFPDAHFAGPTGAEIINSVVSFSAHHLRANGSLTISVFDFLPEAAWRPAMQKYFTEAQRIASLRRNKGATTLAAMAANPTAYLPAALDRDFYSIDVFVLRQPRNRSSSVRAADGL